MEHRWGNRISVDVPVRLRHRGGDAGEGRVVDISQSGAFIRTKVVFGDLARVDVQFDGRVVPSYVTRVASNGVGVEWCESLPGISASALARYLGGPFVAQSR
jgi:hypothetical protein